MSCVEKLVKFIVFGVNFLVVLAALGLIGIGTYFQINFKDVLNEVVKKILEKFPVSESDVQIPSIVTWVPVVVIVLGVVIFLISFSGCCGAIKESRCLLVLYTAFMAILAGIKIYVLVVYLQRPENIIAPADSFLNKQFENQINHFPSANFLAIEGIFTCCGLIGEESYTSVTPTFPVPGTCCSNPFPHPLQPTSYVCNARFPGSPTAEPTHQGCIFRLRELIESYAQKLSNGVILIVCAEALALMLGIYLIVRISNKGRGEKEYKQYY